jgi:hypothetical protein
VALLSSLALLVTVGPSLLWPLGVACAALAYLGLRRRPARAQPAQPETREPARTAA